MNYPRVQNSCYAAGAKHFHHRIVPAVGDGVFRSAATVGQRGAAENSNMLKWFVIRRWAPGGIAVALQQSKLSVEVMQCEK
jgi:hypothetical protein